MPHPSLSQLTEWLRDRHSRILSLETEAKNALYQNNDEPSYRSLMAKRAQCISVLREECAPLLAALADTEIRDNVEDELNRFSAGGKNALRIGSIFYMSALLYPDDHQDGDPDNLERLINSLMERL